ncbi:hypothetical protein QVD17_17800 [Tagetes erecta]|uniref:Protein kinase domain-containing protein n=1 Tax=Tagetes erecta TaxID=13708 RepID=A0AAD8P1R9_TARER|nr:hypothetical protein QVD17_17800 [Tagetes erecta]
MFISGTRFLNMNHYHLYEAIGQGKYSTVYKGRKKKSIEYFALKSLDKSHKSNLLQEVRIFCSLDHPNNTVLEVTSLEQDSKLPEDSVHDLARDLVRGLRFLHEKGIIYCDLKPSNILLDENGRTKLCDFGLSRKLSDISETSSSLLPQAKRGSPCYMAPELFHDGGVHSYASDFWALGCVLYAGRPTPIYSKRIYTIQFLQIQPHHNPTHSFANLVTSLLIKDPAERIQYLWSCLLEHKADSTHFTRFL